MKDLHILPKVKGSWSYLYVEHSKIYQDAKSIIVHDAEGAIQVPCAVQTRSSRNLFRQVRLHSDPELRLQVVRRMYEYRFPGEDLSGLRLEQLRGREGPASGIRKPASSRVQRRFRRNLDFRRPRPSLAEGVPGNGWRCRHSGVLREE